jgi:hypothetical protein
MNMKTQKPSSKERIAEGRRKLNYACIQLYLAAQEKEDERELASIVRGLEIATTELENTGRTVGITALMPGLSAVGGPARRVRLR